MNPNVKLAVITSVSVLLTLFFSDLFRLKTLFYSSIAAVVVSQNCHREVFSLGIKRLYGTFIGAIAGIIFSIIFPHTYISYALGILFTVYICSRFFKTPSNAACIVFLAISVNLDPGVPPFFYGIFRFLDTAVGIIAALVVATIVNLCEKLYIES